MSHAAIAFEYGIDAMLNAIKAKPIKTAFGVVRFFIGCLPLLFYVSFGFSTDLCASYPIKGLD